MCGCGYVCESAAWLHLLHPSPRSYPTRPRSPFSSASVLSGDSSSGTHVPTFWHWPWVIEMQTENTLNQMGSKSSKYLARTFFHWWSRAVYGWWNKVSANGHLVYGAFIWTVLKSNKDNTSLLVETGRMCRSWPANLLSLKIEHEEGQCRSRLRRMKRFILKPTQQEINEEKNITLTTHWVEFYLFKQKEWKLCE